MTTPTFAQRCKLATDCLPQAEYRNRLERLHADMLAEIDQLRAHVQAIADSRHTYGWGPEADAAIEAARLGLWPSV